MFFPEKVEDSPSMSNLIRQVRAVGIRELYLGDSKLVSSIDFATWVSFHDSGKAIARYRRFGDGTWRRVVDDPAGDDTAS